MDFLETAPEPRTCALVAVHNASIWLGTPVEFQTVKEKAVELCGFDTERGGLRTNQIQKLLKSVGIPVKRWRKGTPFYLIVYALFAGAAMVFSYRVKGEKKGHAVIVTPDFKIHNGVNRYKKWKTLFYDICTEKLEFNAWIVGEYDDKRSSSNR